MIDVHNPISDLIAAAQTAFPDLDCVVYFGEIEEGHGVTVWPDDGGRVQVAVSSALALEDALEVPAHELAHVAAGEAAGHGTEWEAAFSAIHDAYEADE